MKNQKIKIEKTTIFKFKQRIKSLVSTKSVYARDTDIYPPNEENT